MIMPASQNRSNCAFRRGLLRLATMPTAKSGLMILQHSSDSKENFLLFHPTLFFFGLLIDFINRLLFIKIYNNNKFISFFLT
jgi:hypothetical protein